MFQSLSERAKKLTLVDIALTKWSVFFAALLIAKLFPALLRINPLVLSALTLVCAARPLYTFWMKK